jgi:hypothetical protein
LAKHSIPAMIYRVRKPLQVIRGEPPKPFTFVEIMPGSIITVKGKVQKSGGVDVLYNGQIFASFMRDIAARAELVEDETTGALVWR